MDCGCIKFLFEELRMSVWYLQHLHSTWDILLLHCSYLEVWAVLLLSPLIFPMCLLLLLTVQTLRWTPLCTRQVVLILSILWLSIMVLICSFADLVLGICWCPKTMLVGFVGRASFLVTLVPQRFVLCCLGIFGGPYVIVLQTSCVLLCYLLKQ